MNTFSRCPKAVYESEHGKWLCNHTCKASSHARFSVKCKYGSMCNKRETCTYFHSERQFSNERMNESMNNNQSNVNVQTTDFENIVNQFRTYDQKQKEKIRYLETLNNENRKLNQQKILLENELKRYKEEYHTLRENYIKRNNIELSEQTLLEFMFRVISSDNSDIKQRFIRNLMVVAHPDKSGGSTSLCHLVDELKTQLKLE